MRAVDDGVGCWDQHAGLTHTLKSYSQRRRRRIEGSKANRI